ncbi:MULTISPECIES: hypothetical protein [Bythopirellula]|uniref:Sigma 54 modulation protein / S30EA ribosomal protein n=2 Tax=Bythopirellula TaxID=1400386 RepID=A0A5C6CJ10_9BACT|nr:MULTISPECIES: hypothetical protein [Bythopirellula]QEG36327.1 hypothetical protein Pr1d_36400 [Bythopirellula goksoeyrii]TWU24783.1 hypothetical protein Pla144_36690 [Bythopirellula polymerisocia]
MKVTVLSQSMSLDNATRKDVQDSICRSLNRFNSEIDEVTVRIGTAGGDSSVLRQLCRLSVRMKKIGSFLVESVGDSTSETVSLAVERAANKLNEFSTGGTMDFASVKGKNHGPRIVRD